MNIGATDGLIRVRSEVVSCLTNFQNGQVVANNVGRRIYFPQAAYQKRRVVQIGVITQDVFNRGKNLPTFAQLAGIIGTFVAPDGTVILADVPLQRLAWSTATPRPFRNLILDPVVLDMEQSWIYTVGVAFNGEVNVEIIYSE